MWIKKKRLTFLLKSFLAISLLITASNVISDEKKDKSSYLLYSQFGEFCTMCESILLCGNDEYEINDEIPTDGKYLLYHLRTRTFWSQVSTIWEFFFNNFDTTKTNSHKRPVDIITIDNNDWSNTIRSEAIISSNHDWFIYFNDRKIDRKTSNWLFTKTNSKLGSCERLPLWKTIDTIDKNRKNDNER